MNMLITGHHLEVTPALREYVTGKLDRITRHFDQVIDIRVLLSMDNKQQGKAEITLHVRGKDLHAACTHTDLYAAIDMLIDKLDRQVLKYKDMRTEHPRDGLKHQVLPS